MSVPRPLRRCRVVNDLLHSPYLDKDALAVIEKQFKLLDEVLPVARPCERDRARARCAPTSARTQARQALP
jgi:hypothetical protein